MVPRLYVHGSQFGLGAQGSEGSIDRVTLIYFVRKLSYCDTLG
jgi:hypothetical protein